MEEVTINSLLHETLNEIIGKGPEVPSKEYFIYKITKIFPKYMTVNVKEYEEGNETTFTEVKPVKENNNYKIYHLYKGNYIVDCYSDDCKKSTYKLKITEDMYGKYYFDNITLEGGSLNA